MWKSSQSKEFTSKEFLNRERKRSFMEGVGDGKRAQSRSGGALDD